MAGKEGAENRTGFVYRVSTADEWEELQREGGTLGRDLDRRTGCIHLSQFHQVKMVLQKYFHGREDLYLLRIDSNKLGNGLIYEAVDASNLFPHFYGPSRTFCPLPFDVVTRVEKLEMLNGKLTCGMLNFL